MNTYSAKPAEVERKWWLIDADGLVLGRLASIVAMRLRGKHKALYTPHIDCGDHVVVVNADKVALTGAKEDDKVYNWHTGYPGGIRSRTVREQRARRPEQIVVKAVERMLPKTKLGRQVISKLHVYAGPEHRHDGQKPAPLDIAAMNPKNARRA
jgi:large subunit ribosomal protein L13